MGVVDDEQEAARTDLRAAAERMNEAADRLAEAREVLRQAVARASEARLSQVEIAHLGGISRPTVREWLRSE